MKLLNILGAVVAVHVAVLVLAIAIPGCRSNGKATATSPASDDAVAAGYTPMPSSSPISSVPEMSDHDLNPAIASSSAPMFDPDAPAVSNPSASSRYTPTRPNSPVATALQPVSVTEVTPVTTYTVKTGDNLWALSKKFKVSVRELAAANSFSAETVLHPGQVLVIPGQAPSAAAAATASVSSTAMGNDADVVTYLIKSGDSLAVIARRFNTTVPALKAFNNLRSDMVRAGDHLAIPPAAASSAAATQVSASTTPSVPTEKASSSTFKHVVARGESAQGIAAKYGIKFSDLVAANQIANPSLIRPGQELIIPGWQGAKAPSTTAVNSTMTPVKSTVPGPNEDLDTGLPDASSVEVPIIQVEDAPEGPVSTIGGGPAAPPEFE